MRPFIHITAAILFALLPALNAAESPRRPNVVIFLTDDESWQERSAYGWSKIPTPHFDRVAREGVLFTRGYASAPSCAPSRASLLTGRNFWELEQGAFIQAWVPAKFATLPELMAAGGYHTGYTGKGWGPGVLAESDRTLNPAGEEFNSSQRPKEQREPGISSGDYAANFQQFLDKRKPDQPFWFWVGCHEPHTPCHAENYKKLASKYGVSLDDIKVPGFLPDTPGVRRSRANMLYEVCHADDDLGRILNILEDRGELANTLLMVTSDNGTQVLRSKANIYDWGVHEPLAVMWPERVKPGRNVADFVNFADLAPTILEAAGLSVPKEMSGRSFLNVLLSSASGRVDPSRSWTVCGLEWHGEFDPVNLAGRTIMDERYQYIVNYSDAPRLVLSPEQRLPDSTYAETAENSDEIDLISKHPDHPAVRRFIPLLVAPRPREELYDLQADPWELNNLADSPPHAEIKARLKAQLETCQRQTKDPRITGDMAIFEKTRQFVQDRKRKGYKDE